MRNLTKIETLCVSESNIYWQKLYRYEWENLSRVEKEYGGESVVSNSSDRNKLAFRNLSEMCESKEIT